MRVITTHIVIGDTAPQLTITALDEPGPGGANHSYLIYGENPDGSRAVIEHVAFQKGPIKEVGVNGITEAALLAILIDRYECFQQGPYATEENMLTLDSLRKALGLQQLRTRRRIARGVEGTSQK